MDFSTAILYKTISKNFYVQLRFVNFYKIYLVPYIEFELCKQKTKIVMEQNFLTYYEKACSHNQILKIYVSKNFFKTFDMFMVIGKH